MQDSPFDRTWAILKDQRPEFNPGETEDGWHGNIPRNAEDAYNAAMLGIPVYYCNSCDAYLDQDKCYGHAYDEGFHQPKGAVANPTGHAFMQPDPRFRGMATVRGAVDTTPAWEMSARSRFGMGYHPVPDPSANIDGSQDGMSMLRDMFGGLEEYQNLPDEDKPRFRDFMQDKQMDEDRMQRLQYMYWLANQSGLTSDELEGMLINDPAHDSYRERPGTGDWNVGLWEELKGLMGDQDD